MLSDIARSRVEAARLLSTLVDSVRLMVTGGFGAHFNTSEWPHRELVHGALASLNVEFDPLLPGSLESGNTIEDMFLIGELLERERIDSCFIITSTFHVSRCQVIFDCICSERTAVFVAARDPDDLSEDLLRHERASLEGIKAAGGIQWKDIWYPQRLAKRRLVDFKTLQSRRHKSGPDPSTSTSPHS